MCYKKCHRETAGNFTPNYAAHYVCLYFVFHHFIKVMTWQVKTCSADIAGTDTDRERGKRQSRKREGRETGREREKREIEKERGRGGERQVERERERERKRERERERERETERRKRRWLSPLNKPCIVKRSK